MPFPPGVKKIHFIGIGGYGMSALAQVLIQQGYKVSGSDLKASPLTENLAKQGADITIGHSAANLGAAGLVVFSTAVSTDNPEICEAKKRSLPLWHRSELLADLLNSSYGIAIAGAHGKTTTTAMVAILLEAGSLDPTAIIGGVLPLYGSNARLGKSRYLVAEADESDSSFTRYYPQLALVTGIEPDHLEHYENDYDALQKAYITFLSHLPISGTAVICRDDPYLCEIGSRLKCRVVYYGLEASEKYLPNYHAANIKFSSGTIVFDLCRKGETIITEISINVPGSHNISNAVGALALADQLDLDLNHAAKGLADFSGVKRRFEVIGSASGITVIDDYAHHPTEVRATLEAARSVAEGKIICLFQPHRYTRTAALFDEFARAFSGADLVFLHSVYSAGEDPIEGADSTALAEAIREHSGTDTVCSDDIVSLQEQAAAAARSGDLIITMGAGDITYSAQAILALLKQTGS